MDARTDGRKDHDDGADRMAKLPPLPVAVVGMGLSGKASLRLLRCAGVPAEQMTSFDAKPGAANFDDWDRMSRDFAPRSLVVSPGVPLAADFLRRARDAGLVITSELRLAAAYLENEKLVGVTGSLGKSTTVSLLGAGLRAFDAHAFVGGNLGFPLADYICDVREGLRPARAQWVVLELSSFQLENLSSLSFDAVAITYLSRNHLERYGDVQEYYDVKWDLISLCRGPAVLNLRGGDLAQEAERRAETFSGAREPLWADREHSPFSAEQLAASRLVGAHNRDNLAVAGSLARACHWPPAALTAMLNFAGLPHRVQWVAEHRGVRFINDSKATTLESVLTAAQSVANETTGQLWLLVGGRDKKLPWDKLAALRGRERLRPVFFGEARELARVGMGIDMQMGEQAGEQTGEQHYPLMHPTLRDAVFALRDHAQPGDTVLLSPGGTSLDEFKNFEDRGAQFTRYAQEIFGHAGAPAGGNSK